MEDQHRKEDQHKKKENLDRREDLGVQLNPEPNAVPGNASFEKRTGLGNATTTGSGYSQAERNEQDGTNNPSILDNRGNQTLIDQYNINDKAHFDSSIDDFVPTKSNFNHAEGQSSQDQP
jgi:hypothetical protein